jgi:deoxyribose-phosphate aldolase
MIDISAVRADSSDQDIHNVIRCAREFNCFLVTILPAQTSLAKALLNNESTPKLGGNVGFPSGGQTTSIKIKETQELIAMGVDEIDMVINVAALLSGRAEDVYHDISEVVQAAAGKPVKVILECHYLNDNFIRIGCDQAIKAGAAFVKTGTGWAPTGATLENITLIKNHVGDEIKIKASGGIRGFDTMVEMYRRGASRFGISMKSAINILSNIQKPMNQ